MLCNFENPAESLPNDAYIEKRKKNLTLDIKGYLHTLLCINHNKHLTILIFSYTSNLFCRQIYIRFSQQCIKSTYIKKNLNTIFNIISIKLNNAEFLFGERTFLFSLKSLIDSIPAFLIKLLLFKGDTY